MTTTNNPVSYTVGFNGQNFGPHSRDEIMSMLNTGMLDQTAVLYAEGWPGWAPIASVMRISAVQEVSQVQEENIVTSTTSYRNPLTSEQRRKLRSYRRRVGRRSFIFQVIIAIWTVLYFCWIGSMFVVAMAHSSGIGPSSYSPSFSIPNPFDVSAGLLSGLMAIGFGWGVVGLPIGIAAIATLREYDA